VRGVGEVGDARHDGAEVVNVVAVLQLRPARHRVDRRVAVVGLPGRRVGRRRDVARVGRQVGQRHRAERAVDRRRLDGHARGDGRRLAPLRREDEAGHQAQRRIHLLDHLEAGVGAARVAADDVGRDHARGVEVVEVDQDHVAIADGPARNRRHDQVAVVVEGQRVVGAERLGGDALLHDHRRLEDAEHRLVGAAVDLQLDLAVDELVRLAGRAGHVLGVLGSSTLMHTIGATECTEKCALAASCSVQLVEVVRQRAALRLELGERVEDRRLVDEGQIARVDRRGAEVPAGRR
jgi:hypothetical protein